MEAVASARGGFICLTPKPSGPNNGLMNEASLGVLLPYIARLVFALFLGGLIGIEREIKGKPAGMRTNMLMCMGTCLLMELSIEVFRVHKGTMGDPSRIASQVMTGIGFLGAGTIIQSRFSVAGLTSAATLWFVAAIGLVVGWGDYFLAGAATVLIIIILTPLSRLEQFVGVKQWRHLLQFEFPMTGSRIRQSKDVFQHHRIHPESMSFERSGRSIIVDVEYLASDANHQSIVTDIGRIEGVKVIFEF